MNNRNNVQGKLNLKNNTLIIITIILKQYIKIIVTNQKIIKNWKK